jgi:hypothetical protein
LRAGALKKPPALCSGAVGRVCDVVRSAAMWSGFAGIVGLGVRARARPPKRALSDFGRALPGELGAFQRGPFRRAAGVREARRARRAELEA